MASEGMHPLTIEVAPGMNQIVILIGKTETIHVRRRTEVDPVIFARKNTPHRDSIPDVLKNIELDENGAKTKKDYRASFVYQIIAQTDKTGKPKYVPRGSQVCVNIQTYDFGDSRASESKGKKEKKTEKVAELKPPSLFSRLCCFCCMSNSTTSKNKVAAEDKSLNSSSNISTINNNNNNRMASPTHESIPEEEEAIEEEDFQPLLPKQRPCDIGKKTLVLDLDETLVHSAFRPMEHHDFEIPVELEGETHIVYVLKRPGVERFLSELGKIFEIVIYTASLGKYADPLLDLLDPTHENIIYRLFREHCVLYENNFIKDLSLLGRDLNNTLIIDNSPNAYIFQVSNGINCLSFVDDLNDRELYDLLIFLKELNSYDVYILLY